MRGFPTSEIEEAREHFEEQYGIKMQQKKEQIEMTIIDFEE